MNKIYTKENGFTLIEVMMAIFILSIGIVALNMLQIRSVKGNADASSISTMSWMTTERVELLMRQDYDTLVGLDGTGTTDGAAGLTDGPDGNTADRSDAGTFPGYTLYWNVANDSPVSGTVAIRVYIVRTRDLKQLQYDYFQGDFL